MQAYYAARAAEYDRIYQKPERQADLRAIEAWLSPFFYPKKRARSGLRTGLGNGVNDGRAFFGFKLLQLGLEFFSAVFGDGQGGHGGAVDSVGGSVWRRQKANRRALPVGG